MVKPYISRLDFISIKSFKIIEDIRITISKDHNNKYRLSIRNCIPNEACNRTYGSPELHAGRNL